MFHTRHYPGVIDAGPPPDGATIGPGGDYLDVQSWWDALPATLTQPEVGILLDGDHVIPNPVIYRGILFSGKTTSAVNTVTLRGQTNHGGAFTGAGARLICQDSRDFSTVLGFENDHVIIEDLVLVNQSPQGTNSARLMSHTSNYTGVLVQRCLGYMDWANGNAEDTRVMTGISGGSSGECRIRDCAFLNVRSGVYGHNSYRSVIVMDHCTVLGASGGASGFCIRRASGRGNIGFDFDLFFDQLGSSGQANNASNRAQAVQWPNVVPADELVSPTLVAATADVHLKSGTTTLQNVISANYGSTSDFEKDTRPQGAQYDCGADEMV